MVLIEGRIRTRKWQDKNGQDRWNTDIQAENIIVLDRRKDGAAHGTGASYPGDKINRDSFPEENPQGKAPFENAREGEDQAFEEDPF
jgi:single-strand DNA-binding protein